MVGRKVAWSNERILAYMIYNNIGKHSLAKMKRLARREDRRYQKNILRIESFLLD